MHQETFAAQIWAARKEQCRLAELLDDLKIARLRAFFQARELPLPIEHRFVHEQQAVSFAHLSQTDQNRTLLKCRKVKPPVFADALILYTIWYYELGIRYLTALERATETDVYRDIQDFHHYCDVLSAVSLDVPLWPFDAPAPWTEYCGLPEGV